MEWKFQTLRNLVKQFKTVCFTTMLLDQAIKHLKTVFTEINEYPINRTVNQELHRTYRLQKTTIKDEGIQNIQIMLLYNGKQDKKLLCKIKKHLNKLLPTEVKVTVTYQYKKLGMKFQLKYKTKFYQQNNLLYYSKCLDKT